MKLLVDAHLPRRLARLLQQLGHDTVHTLDLPDQNRSSDETITQMAMDQRRIVVTKDSDFVDSFFLTHRPPYLLLIATGNIGNRELEQLFFDNIAQITAGFENHDFIELSRHHVIFHV